MDAKYIKFNTSVGGSSSLLTGLVSYWKLNEASGSVVDYGDSNTGTVTNATQSASGGKFSGAVTFDGTGDFVSVGNPSNLQLTTTGAISFWIYPTNITGLHFMISKGDGSNDRNGYYIFSDGVYIGCNLATDSSYLNLSTIDYTISINSWNHIIFMWDNDYLYEYINGNYYNSSNTIGSPTSSIYNFLIGGDNVYSAGTIGKISAVGVWNRILTSSEAITTLYNSGNGIEYPF
jgi:hypothetical protein